MSRSASRTAIAPGHILTACSNAPIWQPVASHATRYRVIFSTRAVSRNDLPAWRWFSSGTRTSVSVIWPFWTTFSAILFSIFSTLNPGVVLFSTTKPFTWLSATFARPDHREIAPRGIADPPLLAVENPRVSLLLCRCQQAPGCSGTDEGFRQAKAADHFEAGHRREPPLLLLFRASGIDGTHGQARCGLRRMSQLTSRRETFPSPPGQTAEAPPPRQP